MELLDLATTLAVNSRCRRSKVGAVLADAEGAIAGIGWNPGRHCGVEGFCSRGSASYADVPESADFSGRGSCDSKHAEQMAIERALRSCFSEAALQGMTMYISRTPCSGCSKIMASFGIKAVYS